MGSIGEELASEKYAVYDPAYDTTISFVNRVSPNKRTPLPIYLIKGKRLVRMLLR